jgi:hypothetical protein
VVENPPVRLLALPAVLVLAALASAGSAGSTERTAAGGPRLIGLNVTNGGTPYAGARPLLTTISPNGDGFRDRAAFHFRLDRIATVLLSVNATKSRLASVYTHRYRLGPGKHTLYWKPKPWRDPRTYLCRLVVTDRAGNRMAYGTTVASPGRHGPVVRVQGIDAAFTRDSYLPGGRARLRVATDATDVELQLFRSGPDATPTVGESEMQGVPVSEPVELSWRDRSDPHTVRVAIPYDEPSGVYFARLREAGGRVGYAPFILRPSKFGSVSRVLVVEPTNTWQAYNFQDADGNGWGDTWYAGPKAHPATLHVRLNRPFQHRGVPPHFRIYDLGFLHWLVWSKKKVDFVADSDLVAFSGVQLRRTYDLIVFPGHEEYVTPHAFAIVRRFRNLGGHLMFLSANNFYWRVVRRGRTLVRTVRWRELHRPEAALVGVGYRANNGTRPQQPFIVRHPLRWLFRDTRVDRGTRLGHFGIEIDSKERASPPGTIVIATIPNIFGRGFTANMTYYETRRGAKVFAFGAFSMGGVATQPPFNTMLENLWRKMVP